MTTPLSHDSVIRSLAGLHERAWDSFGMLVIESRAEHLPALAARLRDELGFALLLDVTAIDYPQRSPRFDVVYHFWSPRHRTRLRVKLQAPGDRPSVPSLTPLFGSARFLEREAHDMYGIAFAGNEDLRPILLYEGFVGHPLRKDYPMEMEQPIVTYRN